MVSHEEGGKKILGCVFQAPEPLLLPLGEKPGSGSLQTHLGWRCHSPCCRRGAVASGTSHKRSEISSVSYELSGMDGLGGDGEGRGQSLGVKRRSDKADICALRPPLSLPFQECRAAAFPSPGEDPPKHSHQRSTAGRITSAQGGAWRTKQPLTALSGNDSTPFRNGSRGKICSSNLIISASCLQRV